MDFASTFTVEDTGSNCVPYALLDIGGGKSEMVLACIIQKEFLNI